MEDKNKIKGWTSYPHKLWRRFVSTDIGFFFLIEFAVVVMGAIAGVIIGVSKGFTTLSDSLEFARLFIAVMIAVGGAYGLILATRRAVKFSEQVDTAQKQVEIGQKQVETGQKQLFNEQLGRAAELLTKEEKPMRRTGIRILEDLAETTINQGLSKENIKQAQLIMRIIHDFVHADTSPPLKDDENLGARIEKGKEKLDIALGIRTLVSLYNESGKLDDLKELVLFRGCRLEGLIFNGAELQGADFTRAKLQGADFTHAKLQGINFSHAELQGAHFNHAELQGVEFVEVKLQGANLGDAELQGANFSFTELEWADCTRANFSDAIDLTEDQVKRMIFDIRDLPTLPKGLENSLDPKYGYELKEIPNDESNFHRRFVNRGEEWSGRWVNEYLTEIGILNPENDG